MMKFLSEYPMYDMLLEKQKNVIWVVFLLLIMLTVCSVDFSFEQGMISIKAKKSHSETKGSSEKLEWKEYETRTVDNIPGFSELKEPNHTQFGGRADRRENATGFFYSKKISDRWWIIDPEGYYFIHCAVVSVKPGGSDGQNNSMKIKFENKQIWLNETGSLLKLNGFNGTGNWSDADLIKESTEALIYTRGFNFMSAYGKIHGGTFQQPGHTGYPSDLIFAFDPQFEKFCDTEAKKVTQYKNEKNLLGYFSDNELPFPEDAINRYLDLDTSDFGYKAALAWLKNNKGGKTDKQNITDEDRANFLGFMSDKYFSIVSQALKKYDPNHMFLGCRFHGKTLKQKPVFESLGKYADIISINYYDVWTPKSESLKKWNDWSGKPVMITEFYVKGDDTGMKNSSGAGWVVPTQKDRGLFYQNFVLALLESKMCVGWHWFKYQDNDPEDKKTDPSNRDSNKGILNNSFIPYTALLQEMAKLNCRLYGIVDYMDKK